MLSFQEAMPGPAQSALPPASACGAEYLPGPSVVPARLFLQSWKETAWLLPSCRLLFISSVGLGGV